MVTVVTVTPLLDPAAAPPRTDLPFLRHRGRRRAAAADPAAAGSVSAFISGRAGHGTHHHETAVAAPSSGSLDLSAPARPQAPQRADNSAGSLDLSAPARTGTPSRADNSAGSLDLSAPAQPQAPQRADNSAGSLDLSTPSEPSRPARPQAPAQRRRSRTHPRIVGDQQRILGIRDPAVWLTRVQSGVGELRIEAVCGAEVGDLRLGALYQFASGPTSTAQYAGGNRYAPSSRRPVLVCGHDEYEYVNLDLRQTPDVRRITVYAFSESRAPLAWGGTLVLTTVADGRIELPLETLRPAAVAVLASIYNVDNQLVVRAEMETIAGDVREAARAYGYDRITWRDSHSPVD